MRTVKEISQLTGISVRTLHYYDEIGLLAPTQKSEGGYRLYDDKALKELQQILFFREFQIPLKEIKAIVENPALDKNEILQMQRKMLVMKQKRMQNLINSIDGILRGENHMDFEVFNKRELEELYQTTVNRMPAFMKEKIIEEFGSITKWKTHYLERTGHRDMQKGYQLLVKWYGEDKDKTLREISKAHSKEVVDALQKREESILKRLYQRKGEDISSFETKSIVGEYGFVMKHFYQMEEEEGLMISLANSFENKDAEKELNFKYGEGAAAFFSSVIKAFYKAK